MQKFESFLEREPVHSFWKDPKFGTWNQAAVKGIRDHFLVLCVGETRREKPITAAYEDVRKVPTSTLLQELDRDEFIPTRSHAIVSRLSEIQSPPSDTLPSLFPELPTYDPVPSHNQNLLNNANSDPFHSIKY